MDFSPSKISLEKFPFWDGHKNAPINTSGFQHVVWIVQNTNRHVWNCFVNWIVQAAIQQSHQEIFIFRCTNHSIVQPPASTLWPITPFGLTTTLRQLCTCRRTTTMKHGIQDCLPHVTYNQLCPWIVGFNLDTSWNNITDEPKFGIIERFSQNFLF